MQTGSEVTAADIAPLESVRRRGVFLVSAAVLAAAGAFALLLVDAVLAASRLLVDHFAALRTVTGPPPPPAGTIDPWLVVVGSVPVLVLALLTVVAWSVWRRTWRRRLQETWGGLPSRAHMRIPSIDRAPARARRHDYLVRLLSAPGWAPAWSAIAAGPLRARLRYADAASVPPAAGDALAEATLAHLDAEVRQRAMTIGFVVAVSPHRILDLATIVVGTLELQLHVLARLGKRPSFLTWWTMWTRCAASLFVNTYLNRHDSLMTTLAIKKTAMGLEAIGEGLDHLGDELSTSFDAGDVDLDGLLGGTAEGAVQVAAFGLTVGGAGASVLARAVDKLGDDLMQGVLAGWILYWHGMSLAADTLALDRPHRDAPAMNRTFPHFARFAVADAGGLLRRYVREYRASLRKRRAAAIPAAMKSVPRGLAGALSSVLDRWIRRE